MAFFLRLALWASLVFWSASELVIDVQPSVISPEITRELVINCSITNNKVQHLEVIKYLTLSRYNEAISEFEDLFILNTSTLILKQQIQLKVSQISYGNTHITLILHNPSQFDAKVYRCNVTGDNAEGTNLSLFAKKAVEYEPNSTALIEELRHYKKNENLQCSLKKDEHTEVKQRSRLHFYGSSEIIRELIEPLTITCLYKTLSQSQNETSALQSLYILHETNGIIAYINKQQPVITTVQGVNLKNVKGDIYDNELEDSYLQVTWNYLKHSESGNYFCEAHIHYPDGRFKKLYEIITIIVQSPSHHDLVKVVQILLSQAEVDEESLRDNNQKLKTIKEDVDSNIQNVISIKKDLNEKQEHILRMNEDLITKHQDIAFLKEDMSSTKQDIVKFKKELDAKQENMKRLNEDLYTNIQNISSMKKDMNTYKESIVGIETDLDSKEQNILSIRREVDTNKQDIVKSKEDLNNTQQSMLRIRENVDTNKHKMSIFQDNLTMMVANLSTELKELQKQIYEVKRLYQGKYISPTSCLNVNSFEARTILILSSGLKVMCDTKTDGGGWIIFQRRINGNVDFYRGWKEYRDGFGDYDIGEFYLGNENIFKLTSTGRYDLRVDLVYDNKTYFAQYEDFKVLSETEKFKLQIGKYSGNASDGLSRHNNMLFSTFDRDNGINSSNCAIVKSGAWWYPYCGTANLNGQWENQYTKRLHWATLPGHGYITFSEMKIRERQ